MNNLQVPENVRAVLHSVVESARATFGETLRSVILYGSAAEGRLRATSDVNLMFVLIRIERSSMDAFRETYRNAQAAIDLTAMFIRSDELSPAAEAFAQKFADIQQRHVVLHGEDVTAALEISREAKIRRLRQSLLNYTMRTREAYVVASLREEQAARLVAEAAGPLRSAAALIFALEGREFADGKAALLQFARELNGAAEKAVSFMSTAREQMLLAPGNAAETLFEVLSVAEAMHERAMRLQ